MALTTKLTPDRVEVPHEPGEWMEITTVSWSGLKIASRKNMAEVMKPFLDLPPEVLERLVGGAGGARASQEDSTDDYDKATILEKGIVAWSYDADVTPHNIAALDEETAEWAFQLIISRNVRTKAEGEASGPGSSPTTLGAVPGPKSFSSSGSARG